MVRGSIARIELEAEQNTKRGGSHGANRIRNGTEHKTRGEHGANRVGNGTERGGNFSGIASEQVPLFENRFGTGFRVLAR